MRPAIQGLPGPVGGGVLGLDEAGRGSLLGPLVVGGFLAPESALPGLSALGARDSKALSPRRREEVYRRLASVGIRLTVALSPAIIDRAVRERGLNRLEARAFAHLIRRARPDRVILDACDPVADRFGRLVRALADVSAPVEARHHADRDEPLVGAASVVAKVRRDRAVRRLAGALERDLGSGYPSDERTLQAVRVELARVGGAPAPWIRHSWATIERLKPAVPVVPLERFQS
ncbi:MAG: ribonuclease HII [Thermoplasmata archaeon]